MTKVSEFSAPIPGMPCRDGPWPEQRATGVLAYSAGGLFITPDCFAAEMIRVYIDRECKGKLRKAYADRIVDERQEFGHKAVTVEGARECQ
jgi:hypothetical protein